MKNILPITLLAFTLGAQASGEKTRILSPDRQTYVDVEMKDGRLTYSAGLRTPALTPKGKPTGDTIDVQLIQPSALGFKSNVGDFSQNLTLEADGGKAVHYAYDLWQSKQSHVEADYQQHSFTVRTGRNKRMTVDFRVGNNKVAFRYSIPMQGETAAIVVDSEATSFRFPDETTTFVCPQSDPMIGWKRTKPSYEEEYVLDAPMTKRSHYGHGFTFPCLFRVGDKGWVELSETGVDGRYCASHISDFSATDGYTIAFPMQGENNGFGSTGAQFGLPGTTPWRTIALGANLKPIVESTVTWDVVEQLYPANYSYKGGRSTWSWIVWQDPSINYDDQVAFIDLASALGWENCLIDGGWETNIGRERMEQLFRYCKQKNVTPSVWYNSNGGWNDAPQCAKNRMYSPIVRKPEMKWLQQNGVNCIKVDFFAGDKQETIKLYEQILSDANDYGIQVIFHGCTLPRGWERMYPNYVGSEAVLASENLIFNQHHDDIEALNACLHPFIRNAVGSMEFGGTILQRRLNRNADGGTTRIVGDVFELGTAIAFQNAVQNFALTPRNLTEQPQFEIDFMKQVPTTWDETRFIDGYPGKYIIMARRHAQRWYVCALNAQKEPLKVNVQLPFLAGQEVLLLEDGNDGKTPAQSKLTLDKKGTFKVVIAGECGAVIY